MKASELIEELQALIKLHGDKDVCLGIYDTEREFERSSYASEVEYDPKYKKYCIR